MSTDTRATRREQREARREEERRRRAETARKARTTRFATIGVIVVLVVIGVALAWRPITETLGASGVSAQGTQYPNAGQDHIQPGESHAPYTSNPPTSGPHYPNAARWGIYDRPLEDELLVHNLEHGGIVVHYNCPDGCPELVEQLKGVVSQHRSKVVLAPRPDPSVPHRITLSAWTWLDGFDEFDEERINAFIRAHRDRGPELVPD